MDADKTPRHPSGSHDIAIAREVCCQRLAVKLDEAASRGLMHRILGRPDLRLQRLAREARAMGTRFRCWYDPPEGTNVSADLMVRAKDLADYAALLAQARALGVTIV